MEPTAHADEVENAPAADSTAPSVGDVLRSRRAELGYTLKEIAATTRIQQANLLALEEERFEELPAEVFTRGFLRSYARELGLDEEDVIALYLEGTGRTRELVPAPTAPMPAAPRAAENNDDPHRLVAPDQTARVLYVAALAVLIIGLALAVLMVTGDDNSAPSTATWQPADTADDFWRPVPAGHDDWQTVREN
ncbi:MAG: helix-turn-helix domain-containing protein [Deltaproteobacteria bacterium]|nr:MAG: helix-turn-helix domain-containing protein [Deltaproteobacteria bacterium]